MAKTIILPILMTVALALQLIFGIKIPDEVLNDASIAIANVVAVSVAIFGIVKNHDKRPEKQPKDKKSDVDA